MGTSAQPPGTPPKDIDDLLRRARQLAGHTIGELSAWVELPLPARLGQAKGFVGTLLERCLGAQAGNRSLPDFTQLGIELKTLPLDEDETAQQSTYVTTVPLHELDKLEWRSSVVYHKLRHVLWLPVQADRRIPLADRVVGQAFLWQPSDEEEQLLRADWEYHMARICAGHVNAISGSDGAVLQVRPKARNARQTTLVELPEQGTLLTRPCGFYLRPAFTRYLIQRYFFGLSPDLPVADSQ